MNNKRLTLKEARITLLVSAERCTIEIYDRLSVTRFIEVKMTAENFVTALGRQRDTECECTLTGLDHVGMKREMSQIEFELPDHTYATRKQVAIEEVKKHTPEGWIADTYFGSQNSFTNQFNKPTIARTSIYRWVEIDENEKTENEKTL